MSEEKLKPGLYVVAVPIGNRDDITLRALKVLQNVDAVICEEFKSGSRTLNQYDIKKPLVPLNEHNEREATQDLIGCLTAKTEAMALISDAGTPLFEDPGTRLVWECHLNDIPVYPVPGVSSLMAALMACGVSSKRFNYYGFLPANKENRVEELKKLRARTSETFIFLDTPYRLKQLLRDMAAILGKDREAMVAWKLTYPEEKVLWGNLSELQTMAEDMPKGEFVMILKKKRRKRQQ